METVGSEAVESWIRMAPESQVAVLRNLRELIRSVAPEAVEEIKWSRPCYSTGRGPLCYLSTTKSYATLGFQRGSSLEDPAGIVEGTGTNMRHVKVRELEGIRDEVFALIQQAAEL